MIIGLDVGGTNTDVVLVNQSGLLDAIKVPTDHENLFATVLSGLERITDGLALSDIQRIVLSTTLTTNAIAENKLPRVGMIVSAGPGINPDNFRTGSDFEIVTGAMDHRGRERVAIDEAQIDAIAEKFQQRDVRYVGVVGKFSTRNQSHENQIANRLADQFKKVFLGHRVAGGLNFPRRIATTYLNAAVTPLHTAFYEAVKNSLQENGITCPIRLLRADGGNMRFEGSLETPAQTIWSGPAASVMGALAHAPEDQDCLILDIGGTTTDMAILVRQAPLLDPVGITIGPYRTLIRSLETQSVGFGGDSAVRWRDGRICIGPDRVGPPMVHGGPVPTPTDAMYVLGLIEEDLVEKAIAGMAPLARQMNCSTEEAAEQIFNGTCQQILDAAREMILAVNGKPVYTVHEMLEGHTVRPAQILVLGGPAHAFAERLQQLSELPTRAVPRWQVANAIGAALARTTSGVTLFADTEQGVATAPQEGFEEAVNHQFDKQAAVHMAFELLRKKALARGADAEHLTMEVVEAQQFNMVRGFYTAGRNIRVRVQVKPGLIHGYNPIADVLD